MRFVSMLVAAGLVLTACDSGDPAAEPAKKPTKRPQTTTTSQSSSADAATTWVDGFCGAVKGFLTDQNNLPAPGQGGSVEEIQKSTSDLLGNFAGVLDKALTALAALPTAPDPIAEAAMKTVIDNYTGARDTAAAAKTELDAAAPDDAAAQGRAVDAMIAAQEQAHRSLDPVAPLIESPELSEAAASAPNCGA